MHIFLERLSGIHKKGAAQEHIEYVQEGLDRVPTPCVLVYNRLHFCLFRAITLPGDMQFGMKSFNQNGSVPYICLYFFFVFVLDLFAEAGLPRLIPPPYPPESDDRKSLVLEASADADASELFWFSGSIFIGRTKPHEKLF